MAGEIVKGMAEAIEARRLWRNLSPTEFAREAGVTIQGLMPIRRGERRDYQHKSRVGVARALWWPDDAIDRLLAGDDPDGFADVIPPGAEHPDVAAKVAELDAAMAELRDRVRALEEATPTTPGRRPSSRRGET